MSVVPPNVSSASTSTSNEWNEGLALFVTFAILFLLSTWSVTAKFALWVGIALVALVWLNALAPGAGGSSSPAKQFWNALSQ